MIVRANQRGSRATLPVVLSSLVLLAAFALPSSAAEQGEAPCEAVDPAWSPDGSTIAFQTNAGGRYSILGIDPGGASSSRRPVLVDFALQPRVVGVILAITGASGLLFGLAPARPKA